MPRRLTFSILDLFVFSAAVAVLLLMNLQTHDGVRNEIAYSGFPLRHVVKSVETAYPSYGEAYIQTTIAWKRVVFNVIICALLAAACSLGFRLVRIWTFRLIHHQRIGNDG